MYYDKIYLNFNLILVLFQLIKVIKFKDPFLRNDGTYRTNSHGYLNQGHVTFHVLLIQCKFIPLFSYTPGTYRHHPKFIMESQISCDFA